MKLREWGLPALERQPKPRAGEGRQCPPPKQWDRFIGQFYERQVYTLKEYGLELWRAWGPAPLGEEMPAMEVVNG